jgi:protoheme IX farnesyltransferase
VLLTAAAGFYLGSQGGVDVWLLVRTLIGVALVAGGTNAFNQVRERDVDARMRRTERRPLPSGRLTPRAAALFAGVISVAGVCYLALAVNLLTAGLAALTLALAWIYREDYQRGGLAMLSVADPDGRHTGRMVLLYAMALLPVSLLPTLLGVTGALYFFGALTLGLAYTGVSVAMTGAVTTARAWRVFLVSIVYLPALLTLMVVDKVV